MSKKKTGRPEGADTPSTLAIREMRGVVTLNNMARGAAMQFIKILQDRVKENPATAAEALSAIGALLSGTSKGFEGTLKSAASLEGKVGPQNGSKMEDLL